MIIPWRYVATLGLIAFGPSAAAQTTSPVEARTLFERFVGAQNAHDAPAVEALLWDAPDFLWVPRTGIPIWGREAAMERFRANYRGNWRLEPDMAQFRAVTLGDSAIQLFVPLMLTRWPAGPAHTACACSHEPDVGAHGLWLADCHASAFPATELRPNRP